jgi:hypothetical protein
LLHRRGVARSDLFCKAVPEDSRSADPENSLGMSSSERGTSSSDDDYYDNDEQYGSSWYDVDYLHAGTPKYGQRLHDYACAWSWLRSVRVFAQFVERSYRFDATPARGTTTATTGGPAEINASAATNTSFSNSPFLLAALGMKIVPQSQDGAAVEPPMRLVDAVNDVYETEEAFSQKLFGEMVGCFREAGWTVRTILRAPRLWTSSAPMDIDREGDDQTNEAERDEANPMDDKETGDYEEMGNVAEEKSKDEEVHCMEGDVDEEKLILDFMVVLGRREGHPFPSHAPSTYVLQIGEYQYAMGLCRAMEKDEYITFHDKGGFFPDHSWAIFRKKGDGEWLVYHVLVGVELTMNNMACRVYKVEEGWRSYNDEKELGVSRYCFHKRNDTAFGTLGEAIRNVVDQLLRGRAMLGLWLPVEVPFAVVTGKRHRAKPRKEPTCWTHGNLCPPEECGGEYAFNVDAFGTFHDHSGQEAVTAYLDVLASGLVAAEIWLGQCADRSRLLTPSPMSGRSLMFGSQALDGVRFVASPLTRKSRGASSSGGGRLKISQGELFRGAIDLALLRKDVPDGNQVMWYSDAAKAQGVADVLIKVSSDPCYGRVVGDEGLLQRSYEFKRFRESIAATTIPQCLAPSLYGVFVPSFAGLVQIMPDLTKSGFERLRPRSLTEAGESKMFWCSFRQFLEGVLLPLADAGVIHPDIRPGYDATSNLLYSKDTGEIRMIDLDSLVFLHNYKSNFNQDTRIISVHRSFYPYQREISTATDFLFGQVVVITESWFKEVADRDADANELFRHSDLGVEWLKDESIKCDGDFIVATLDRIGRRFDS